MNMDYILFTIIIMVITYLVDRKRRLLFSQVDQKQQGLRYAPMVMMSSVFLLIIGGWFLVNYEEQMEQNEIYQSIAGIAPTIALDLEKMNHHEIQVDSSPQDPSYRWMIQSMIDWMRVNPQIDSMYTLRKMSDDRNVFILGPETDYDRNGIIQGTREERVPLGEEYTALIEELEEAFQGITTFQSQANEDQWGSYVTAYAPIYNPTGEVDAVLGIDLNESKWIQQLQVIRLKTIGFLASLYLIIITTYWVNSHYRLALRRLEQQELEVLNSEARYQNLVGLSPDAILVLQNDKIIYINQVGLHLLSVNQKQEAIGKSIFSFFHGDDHEFIKQLIVQMELGGKIEILEKEIKNRNGHANIHIEVSGSSIYFGDRPCFQLVFRDISKRKQQEEKIYYQAYFDSLTDLPNRHFVYEEMHRLLDQNQRLEQPMTVMMIDLDRFKWINETFGHEIGDQFLKETALRLKKAIRDEDTLSRHSADEFVLLLPHLSRTTAVKVAKRILAQFKEPFQIYSQDIFLTVSLGISSCPEDGQTATSLLKNAEQALNYAKSRGNHSFQFYVPEMHSLISRKVIIETGLRKAIERKEFMLHYQPQIELGSNRIAGVEALIRWQHNEEMISPAEFIPIAEETGMIIPIGEWILHTACQQLKRWLNQGFPPMRMAVNLSSVQFMDAYIVETISEVIQETGIPAELLEIEITESLAMNVDQTLDKLIQIKQLGVQISIDDFGTGYSSLSYLKKFPIDKLKIDQSFVKNIPHDADDISIVSTIISMAHHLGLTVIAEGTETVEQVQFLTQQRCEEAQGYVFAKPLPSKEIEEYLLVKGNEKMNQAM